MADLVGEIRAFRRPSIHVVAVKIAQAKSPEFNIKALPAKAQNIGSRSAIVFR